MYTHDDDGHLVKASVNLSLSLSLPGIRLLPPVPREQEGLGIFHLGGESLAKGETRKIDSKSEEEQQIKKNVAQEVMSPVQ